MTNKRQKSENELDVDLDSSVEEEEDLSSLSTDDLCRRFLPMIPKINKKVHKITTALKTHTEEINGLNEKVSKLDKTVVGLQKKNEYLYRKVHQNNLILTGLKEGGDKENILESVRQLFENKLTLTPDIQSAFRIGIKHATKARPVKITFTHFTERQLVWEKKKQLLRPHYLSEDVHKKERERRGVLIAHAKKLSEKANEIKISFKRGEKYADGTTYVFNDGQVLLKRPKVPSA